MAKVAVRQVKDEDDKDQWIVADCYDGNMLAGPFETAAKAHNAMGSAEKKAAAKEKARSEAYLRQRGR